MYLYACSLIALERKHVFAPNWHSYSRYYSLGPVRGHKTSTTQEKCHQFDFR